MRVNFTYLLNFVAPGLILLPRQTVDAVGHRAGAVFFALHLDSFIVTRNFTAIYRDQVPRQFHLYTKITAFYLDWQKTRHRDPSLALWAGSDGT
jgi:hypothetical protein